MAWKITNRTNYADIHANSGELTYGSTLCGGVPTSCNETTSYSVTYELEEDTNNFDGYINDLGKIEVTINNISCNRECFVMWFNNGSSNYSYNEVLRYNSCFDMKNVDECNHVLIVESGSSNPIHVGGQSFETSAYTDSGFPEIASYPCNERGSFFKVYYSGETVNGHKFKYHVKEQKALLNNGFLSGNTDLVEVYFPHVGNVITETGDYSFANCTSLKGVTFGSVEVIDIGAFSGCTNLSRIDWGHRQQNCIKNSSITDILENAFANCTKLTELCLNYAPNLKTIGNGAFSSCTRITSVTFPNSLISIGNSAFEDCSSLTSITIPTSITSINNYTFNNCISLTSIVIPDSVTSIGGYAFTYCTSLTNIDIPNSVTSIGNNAFAHCSSLTSCTIGSGVTSISGYAFTYCGNLTNIDIPNSVTSIGNNAFDMCDVLSSVIVRSTTPRTLGSNVFDSTSDNLVIYVPSGSVDAYKEASGWSTYKDRIQAIP